MATDAFLKIEGIKGESQDKTHKDEIDILSWSWGQSQSATTHIGGGGGGGRVNFQDLAIVKYIDKSTPPLMQHCADGKHISSATMVIRKAAGNKQLEYITLKMEDIIISSISSGGSGAEDRITESITLNFAKFDYKYIEQKNDGGEGAKPQLKWNIAERSEA